MNKFLPFVILFLSALNLCAQQISSKRNFPGDSRGGAVSFVINDTAYVGLGNGDSLSNDFYKYDQIKDVWTKIADFPGEKRTNATAFSLSGRGFVGLGTSGDSQYKYYNDFYEFDPAHNQWYEVADFPGSARASVASFVIGNMAYVGTGTDTSGELGDFYSFNGQSWYKVAGLDPTEDRMSAVGFSINGKGYILGGSSFNNFTTTIYSNVLEYDPIKNTWNTKVFADANLSISDAAVFVQNNIAYICYGNYKYSVSTYNPLNDSTKNLGDVLKLDTRSNPVAFAIGSKSYFGLGEAFDTDNGVEVYFNDLKLIDFSTLTGTSKSILPENVTIYPNPCSDNLCLNASQFNERVDKVEILSASNGTVLKKIPANGDMSPIYLDLNGLDAGIYMIEISTTQNVYFKKFIKE